MNTWINFKELRTELDFEEILRHYKVEIRRKGDQHLGFCPLPDHNGKKNSPSFSANLERGIFKCFGCGAKGNLLEFAALMEGVDSTDGKAFRALALELRQRFCPGVEETPERTKPVSKERPKIEPRKSVVAIVNAPLDFELKGLDETHPYLKSRGFSAETLAYFGLGFCSRGLLKNRIAIPLRNEAGKLIGYAGRVVDDGAICEENPRYRFPSRREHEGKVFEFRKTHFLYNGHRITSLVPDLILVEGFASVWWLHQNGLPHVVATMGADCSQRQAELIISSVQSTGRVWILSDGDDAGERFGKSALLEISPYRFVRWVRLGENRQPTDYTGEELRQLMNP